MKEIKITTPFIKLDQLLKFADVVQSGGEAKMIIADGEVLLNEVVETQRGKKIVPGDIVKANSVEIKVLGE